jgi:plastocyanin
MRKIILSSMLAVLVLAPMSGVSAVPDMATKMSGRILLQIQSKGQGWYVDPATKTRAYLGRPADAYNIMKSLGLGMTNDDLKKIVISSSNSGGNATFARKYSGRILIQVQGHGEAWYVNPTNLKRYYLGRPTDAFSVMRTLGLGISNVDLAKIPVNKKFPEPSTAAATTLNISIVGSSYSPAAPKIKRGMTVVWTNNEDIYHTVTKTADALPGFDSHTLSKGQSFKYTFTKAGIYNYGCSLHTMMKGQIIVE